VQIRGIDPLFAAWSYCRQPQKELAKLARDSIGMIFRFR